MILVNPQESRTDQYFVIVQGDPAVLDAAPIGAAPRVVRYELAEYELVSTNWRSTSRAMLTPSQQRWHDGCTGRGSCFCSSAVRSRRAT